MEEWRSIPGYEGLYEVSSYGRVRSLDRYVKYSNGIMHLHKGRILSTGKDKDGYFIVCLYKNKTHKFYHIHRLVALTFIPNSDNFPCVNHKDEDKTNNRLDNLEWCNHKYNMNYNDVLKRRSQRMKENGIYEKIALKNIKYPELIGLDEREYMREYMREYREEHREYYREYQREYYREYRKKKRGQ